MRLIVGISGASGVVLGVRLLEVLGEVQDVETHLVITDGARQILASETEFKDDYVQSLASHVYSNTDLASPIASGSFLTDGMVVIPCSMKTLSGIAHSFSENLLLRAADVTLKERRPLVLVPRETPFHLGHLRLMAQAVEMGAIIMPPIPAFYHSPQTIADLVDQIVNHALDLLGVKLPRDLYRRWSSTGLRERPE